VGFLWAKKKKNPQAEACATKGTPGAVAKHFFPGQTYFHEHV
jgi:hypothetical protein